MTPVLANQLRHIRLFRLARWGNTHLSESGAHYFDASGEKIYNKGQLTVVGQDCKFQNRGVIFQVAKVTKPLFAGAQAASAGFRTVLEENEKGENISYMQHKTTGEITPIDVVNGCYCVDLWVDENPKDEETSGFTRQGNP